MDEPRGIFLWHWNQVRRDVTQRGGPRGTFPKPGKVPREGWERFSGEPHKLPKQVRVLPPQMQEKYPGGVGYFSCICEARPLRIDMRARRPATKKN